MVQLRAAAKLDVSFGALADSTRRGILERLGRGDASITELASDFDMTLTGMKKHVSLLEAAGFVETEKVGRVRTCRLGAHGLEAETTWIDSHRRALEARLDRLEAFLERTKGKTS
jgi:DNA-binding transcriptional ArsR family regulator